MATYTYNSDAPVLDNYHAVVSAFSDFLTVAIHTILYERNIYPQSSFLAARKFNCPVRQSRHPKVCQWIQDAVAAVEAEMLKVRTLNRYITLWLFGGLARLVECCWVNVLLLVEVR